MLKFSKKTEYAIISMLYMTARHGGELTTARELSETFNIPQEIIGKVLQSLTRANLVNSVQGVKGGYQMTATAEQLRLTQIIEAVNGPIKVVKCVDDAVGCTCEQLDFCNMRNPMEILQSRLVEFFDGISLQDLRNNLAAEQLTAGKRAAATSNVNLIETINNPN